MQEDKKQYKMRYVARVVIEFTTAFHVGSGTISDDEMVDMAVVTDGNDLAAIPGDSIAGVLRAAWKRSQSTIDASSLFGYGPEQGGNGHGSRLDVSWAYIHDSKNNPITTILDQEKLYEDTILTSALTPDVREHNRISHRGTAEETGLFNEYAVCPGHRYTFELHFTGTPEEEERIWQPLLHLLYAPWLRLGGKSRRGFGAFSVISVQQRKFDLDEEKDLQLYSKLSPDLAQQTNILKSLKVNRESSPSDPGITITLPLSPRAYWMFGMGEDRSGDTNKADMAPVSGRRVCWENDGEKDIGRLKTVPFIPGSAIKGPIAHRTAFHYNQLTEKFADDLAGQCANTRAGFLQANDILAPHATAQKNIAVREIFGQAKNNSPDATVGRRGQVIIDDIFLDAEPPAALVPHAPIDRFTSGALNLFQERPFYKGHIPDITLVITDTTDISCDSLKALKRALRDLCLARLPLGGGSGRGLGRFVAPDCDECLQPLTECIKKKEKQEEKSNDTAS